MTMNIFAPAANGADQSPDLSLSELGSLVTLQQEAPAVTPQAATQPTQIHAGRTIDPNQQQIVDAVVFMRGEYWSQGKMNGALLEQWQRLFAQLVQGARTAQEVSNAAHLADYAFVVGLRRQNSKAPK